MLPTSVAGTRLLRKTMPLLIVHRIDFEDISFVSIHQRIPKVSTITRHLLRRVDLEFINISFLVVPFQECQCQCQVILHHLVCGQTLHLNNLRTIFVVVLLFILIRIRMGRWNVSSNLSREEFGEYIYIFNRFNNPHPFHLEEVLQLDFEQNAHVHPHVYSPLHSPRNPRVPVFLFRYDASYTML
jgi:hypothetical protein